MCSSPSLLSVICISDFPVLTLVRVLTDSALGSPLGLTSRYSDLCLYFDYDFCSVPIHSCFFILVRPGPGPLVPRPVQRLMRLAHMHSTLQFSSIQFNKNETDISGAIKSIITTALTLELDGIYQSGIGLAFLKMFSCISYSSNCSPPQVLNN